MTLYIVFYKLTIFIYVYNRIQELPEGSHLWSSNPGQDNSIELAKAMALGLPCLSDLIQTGETERHCWDQDMALLFEVLGRLPSLPLLPLGSEDLTVQE